MIKRSIRINGSTYMVPHPVAVALGCLELEAEAWRKAFPCHYWDGDRIAAFDVPDVQEPV